MAAAAWQLPTAEEIILEFLGWLPARALRCAHRATRTETASAMFRRHLHDLQGASPPLALTHEELARWLWRATTGPLRRHESPPGANLRRPQALGGAGVRDVVVRFHSRRPWYTAAAATPVARGDLMRVFPQPTFAGALHVVFRHGDHFMHRHTTTLHRASRAHCILTEVFALDCTLAGFEVSLRMTFRTVVPAS